MSRYILTMTLDNEPPGTDVTENYKPSVLLRLIEEGYVEIVEDDDADMSDLAAYWPDVADAAVGDDDEVSDGD